MEKINDLIQNASMNEYKEMDTQTAEQLGVLLDAHFDCPDTELMRSLQRGNCATSLVTSGCDLLVLKEHVHDDNDWFVPFNVLNDIALYLFIYDKLKDCKYLPHVVSVSISKHVSLIITKFIPLSFENLFCRILPISFVKVRCFELLTVISILHSHGFAHRDIKPENVRFESDGTLVLIDFDTACKRKKNIWRTKPVCSISTRPPELMIQNNIPYNAFACDIFSAGCVIYAMVNNGNLPFRMNDDGKAYCSDSERHHQIQNFKPTKRVAYRIGDLGVDLLHQMLRYDPLLRPTASDLLKHGFF